jgi:hypothetical protein
MAHRTCRGLDGRFTAVQKGRSRATPSVHPAHRTRRRQTRHVCGIPAYVRVQCSDRRHHGRRIDPRQRCGCHRELDWCARFRQGFGRNELEPAANARRRHDSSAQEAVSSTMIGVCFVVLTVWRTRRTSSKASRGEPLRDYETIVVEHRLFSFISSNWRTAHRHDDDCQGAHGHAPTRPASLSRRPQDVERRDCLRQPDTTRIPR